MIDSSTMFSTVYDKLVEEGSIASKNLGNSTNSRSPRSRGLTVNGIRNLCRCSLVRLIRSEFLIEYFTGAYNVAHI